MQLPNELTLQVLGHQQSHDLKIARLVCKTWSHYAAELLFHKVYISPREEDIRVFRLITQHPQLRRCVKELEYDTTRFYSLSDRAYFLRLVNCTPVDGLLNDISMDQDSFQKVYNARQKEDFDPQIDDYLKILGPSRTQSALELVYEQCEHYHFIVEGYRKWQECYTYQRMCLKSGDFLRILVSGLRNLDRLESVLVCHEWNIRPSRLLDPYQSHHYNSPFGRTWDLLRAQPMSSLETRTSSDGFDEFWSLTTALAFAQRRIRRFYIRTLPPVVFDTLRHDSLQHHATQSMVECSVDAYSRLEHLSLAFRHGPRKIQNDKLTGLRSLLKSMAGLKTLALWFPVHSWHPTYEQVLPSECQWTELISFKLSAMAISAKLLVHLLTVRTPKLQKLYLSHVELVEGRWEGVIECMERSTQLFEISLWDCWHLGRRDDTVPYILRGGRHPCLLPDELDSASDEYLSAPLI